MHCVSIISFPFLFSVFLNIICRRDELQKAINAESDARSYLREELSRQYSEKCFISAEANWKYATNITKENEKNKVISR